MKLKDAAKELGVSTRSLYRLISEGLLRYQLLPVSRPTLAYHIEETYLRRIQRRLGKEEKLNGRVSTLRTILREI